MDSSLCHIDRAFFERLQEVWVYADSQLERKLKDAVKVFKITKNRNKIQEVLASIEKQCLKKSNYNLVMRNIPRTAIESKSRKEVPVTFKTLRDTMNQFGKVSNLVIRHGVAYIEMSDNVYTHNTLNNMQIGKNIITTEVV
jgi:hypothetical protein